MSNQEISQLTPHNSYFTGVDMKLVFRFLSFVALVAALAACSPFGDDNTPPPSPLVNFNATAAYLPLWSANVGKGDDDNYLRFAVASDQGRLFTTDVNGNVLATNAVDGKRIWRTQLNKAITSGVGMGAGLVFVGDNTGALYALDEHTGNLRWQVTLENQALATPEAQNNVVLVKTVDDEVYALNAQNGKTLWTFANAAPQMILRFGSTPKIAGDKVVIGTADGKVFVLSLADGTILWQQQLATPQGTTEAQQMVDVDVNPVMEEGNIYIATYQGNIASLQLDTGVTNWQKNLSSYTGIALGKDNLFITDANSHIWMFSKADGSVTWQQDELAYRDITAPALSDQYVIVGDAEGYLHVLSRSTGQFALRIPVGQTEPKNNQNPKNLQSSILSAPIVEGDKVYVLTRTGQLFAYQIVPLGTKDALHSQTPSHWADFWPVLIGTGLAIAAPFM